MSDRGMKKWAPFSSLIEQSICIEKMKYEKNKIEKPQISNEKAEEINRILSNYHGQTVTIKYFYDGYLYKISTIIQQIDINEKSIITPKGKIPFKEIIDLSDDSIDF